MTNPDSATPPPPTDPAGLPPPHKAASRGAGALPASPADQGRPVVASAPANSELGQIAEQVGLRVEPEDGAGFAGAVRQLEGEAESLEQP